MTYCLEGILAAQCAIQCLAWVRLFLVFFGGKGTSDDAFKAAYTAVLPDETAESAVIFMDSRFLIYRT